MVETSHERADRMMGLFSPAAHWRGQLVLLGFGDLDTDGSALPLALFGLGQDNPHRGGSPAAPLALRLFVEAVLAVGLNDRARTSPSRCKSRSAISWVCIRGPGSPAQRILAATHAGRGPGLDGRPGSVG